MLFVANESDLNFLGGINFGHKQRSNSSKSRIHLNPKCTDICMLSFQGKIKLLRH